MVTVITYGTYDLLHYGHIRLLERAKALGDYLIVGVTVVVAISAMVHAYPEIAHCFAEAGPAGVLLWNRYILLKAFDVVGRWAVAADAVFKVREPYCAVVVNIQAGNLAVSLGNGLWCLSVREGQNLSRARTNIYIIAIRVEYADVLISEQSLVLYGQIVDIQTVNTPVCTYPDVVMIAFCYAFHRHVGGHDELRLIVAGVVGVESHFVETNAVNRCKHVAAAGDDKWILRAQVVMSVHALKWVDELVSFSVEHKDSSVVHAHPDVLPVVNHQVKNAVVQIGYMATVTRAIIVEIIAIEARQSVPCCYPYKSVIVLYHARYRIAAQTVFGREVR